MRTSLVLSFFALFISYSTTAQVGIGTTTPHASLEVVSSNMAAPAPTDGILVPKVLEFPLINPSIDQDGMIVYATGGGSVAKGFYFWNHVATTWIEIGAEAGWGKMGNTGTNPSTNFIGTTDAQELSIRTNNLEKLRVTQKGQLEFFNTGSSVFVGGLAGENDDLSQNENTFVGFQAGFFTTSGSENTAIGRAALVGNSTGSNNVALGRNAMGNTTTGSNNVSVGSYSMVRNTIGMENIAIGRAALDFNQSGNRNVAIGIHAGRGSSVGSSKTGGVFIGHSAGVNEDGDNKLYIDNSSTNNPLLYGEFDTNVLRVNGSLQVGNPATTGFEFPVLDGANGQALVSDGAGNIDWQNTAIAAINGVVLNSGTVQLGGSLTADRTIDFQTNTLRLLMDEDNGFFGEGFLIENYLGEEIFYVLGHNDIRVGARTTWGHPTNGNQFAQITRTGSNAGRFSLSVNGSPSVILNTDQHFIFNELGLNRDFRIESDNVSHMFFLDAGVDVVKFGRATTNLNDDNDVINGVVLNYVADFENPLSVSGTTIGIGSAEYIADLGTNTLAVNGNFYPAVDNTYDLGFPALRWDDVWATNGLIQTSDLREKENIKALDYGLAEILALETLQFQWKGDYDRSEKIGFSAQQLQQLIPEVVKDHYYEMPEDGAPPIRKAAERLGVYYSDLIPVLVRAIQQQNAKISNLEQRIQALENR